MISGNETAVKSMPKLNKPKTEDVDLDIDDDQSNLSDSEEDDVSDPLGEHTFLVIYALHTIQDSLVSPVLPTVELKLKSTIMRERKRAFRLLARLFCEPVIYLNII